MLNELHALADALEAHGIVPREWHKELKPLPGGRCYRIWIGENGIEDIEAIEDELKNKLRKWERDNGSSFPGLNINPLYDISSGDEDRKKLLTKWKKEGGIDQSVLESWLIDENVGWKANDQKKLAKCLGAIPQDFSRLMESVGEKTPIHCNLQLLIDRSRRYGRDPKILFAELKGVLLKKVQDRQNVPLVLDLLFHVAGSSGRSLFFDVHDYHDTPVAHQDTVDVINSILLDTPSDGKSGTDAFGADDIIPDDTMPSVNLKILGNVILRAMSDQSKCQARYGVIKNASFPAGTRERVRMKGALEWLGSPEHKGDTWGVISSSDKEVLFAYPVLLPDTPACIVSLFGVGGEENSSARFSDAARDVIQRLRGRNTEFRSIEINVFALKKMDKARTKVIFYRNYTTQRLHDAVIDWETGSVNIPDMEIPTWGDENGKVVRKSPQIPFPLDVARCLNRVWKQDGTSVADKRMIRSTEGINLLLDEFPERFVPRLMSVLLQNARSLLFFAGQEMHGGRVIRTDKRNGDILLLLSLIGLFLHKVGISKEGYMVDAPFLVGRMLKVSDELHALYCKHVRKGELPPQLVGNSMMSTALESPVQTLSQLALRLKPYLGWAMTQTTNDAGLSRYFLRVYQESADTLEKLGLPSRLNDEQRAQLLLGYLGSLPKIKKSTDNQPLESSGGGDDE